MKQIIWPLEPFDYKRHDKRPISGTDETNGSYCLKTNSILQRWGTSQHLVETVNQLHCQLKLNPNIRREIDRYLLAFGANFEEPVSWMVLTPMDTYCYENLPDMISFFRTSFQALCPDTTIQKILNMFLFGKRYKRSNVAPPPTMQTISAVVNMLHGLVLGLYPFNVRHMSFQHRCKIAWTMRKLLCMPMSEQIKFIDNHQYMFALSFVEYFVNVISEFAPNEWSMMAMTVVNASSCNSICDDFRSSIEQHVLPEINWDACDNVAKQYVAVVLKFFRQGLYFQQSIWKKPVSLEIVNYLPIALKCNVITHSQPGQIAALLKMCYSNISYTETEAIEEIWNTVFIRDLPASIIQEQTKVLGAYGQFCEQLEATALRKQICLRCALLKSDILTANIRYDCYNDKVICDTCKGDTTGVNILGRVLYVRNNVYVMCSLCLSLKAWGGNCSCQRQKKARVDACFVCRNKTVVNKKRVVDVENLELKEISFCAKHSFAIILSNTTIYDTFSIKQQFSSSICQFNSNEVVGVDTSTMTAYDIEINKGYFLEDGTL